VYWRYICFTFTSHPSCIHPNECNILKMVMIYKLIRVLLLLRYFPDLLSFILWIHFLHNRSLGCCIQHPHQVKSPSNESSTPIFPLFNLPCSGKFFCKEEKIQRNNRFLTAYSGYFIEFIIISYLLHVGEDLFATSVEEDSFRQSFP
jgi:hypothetical protein